MRYLVVWSPLAEDELVQLWTNAADSGEIAHAATVINSIRSIDPARVGESRPKNQRIVFVAPLGVRFVADEQRHMVTVIAVWSFRRKNK